MEIKKLHSDSKTMAFFNAVSSTIEKIPYFWLFALLLSAFYLSLVPNSNEEQYLQLAKQFMDPSWIPNASALTEFPGTRLIYQVVIGSVLKFLSFEATTLLFRAILIGLASLALSKIYRQLQVSKLLAIFHLCVLFLADQAFFAGSWMFISVEPKGFAYPIVLFAVSALFRKKHGLVILLLFAATYVHILVGFYAAFYLFLAVIITRKKAGMAWNGIFIHGLAYTLSLAPLVLYVKSAVDVTLLPDLPSPDWIYTYYRSPHHTALFKNSGYFLDHHFFGVLLSALAALFLILLPKKESFPLLLSRWFAIASITGSLLFVLVAMLDKEGVLLKYYPFRIMTLSTFFTGICIISWCYDSLSDRQLPLVRLALVLLSFYGFLNLFIPNALSNRYALFREDPLKQACAFINSKSEKGKKIFSFESRASVTRFTERDRYCVNKFIPADFSKVQEWYVKDQKRLSICAEPSGMHAFCDQEGIGTVLALSSTKMPAGFLEVYRNDGYAVYQWFTMDKSQ